MGNELISIVVPIYNVEKYLRQCLDSILDQTYEHFECLLINDGSTDSSQQIAEEYLMDSRFKLINQSNKGLSEARNTGISHIREESTFVAFVDSDDYIYPDFLETLIEHIEDDVDIIEGMIEYFHDEIKVDNISHNFEKQILTTKDDKLGELALNELRVSVFPKLFRKSLLTEDFFPKGWIFEDLAVVPELVSGSKKWIKLPKVIYGYRIRPNSITTNEFSEEKLDVFKIFEKYDLFFKDESDRTKLLVEKLKYLHLNYHDMEFVPENTQYKQLYKQEKQKLLSKIADYESKALISIIVPIYNVEKYLRQCLDSVLNQTYQNFECLLINDGSPDNSAGICKEYVDKDARFHYFEKENGGLASARNFGIKYSKGKYITFIDSDDWVESDYLEVLHSKIKEYNTDFVISSYKKFDMDEDCFYLHIWDQDYYERIWTSQELLSQLPNLENYDGSYTVSWGKLFKRSLFDEILFNEQRKFGEDFECSFKLYLSMTSCLYIHKALYNYRLHPESMLGQVVTERQLMDDIEIRVGRLPYLIVRGIDSSPYISNLKSFIQYRINEKEKVGLENSNAIQMYQEILRNL